MLGRSLLQPEMALESATAAVPAGPFELQRLFKESYARIWRLLRGLGVAPDRVDDAAQQVFLVYAERHADVAAGSERSFLFGTALRVAHGFRRTANREVPGDLDLACSSLPGVDELTDQKRARQLLDLLLD